MKKQTRAIAFDDGNFTFRDGRVPLVGVIARLPSYVEGAIVTDCEVDGRDASGKVVEAILGSRLREQLRVVMLDGIACGGFNVYDLALIHRATGIPVISVTRSEPDKDEMRNALMKHFPDWKERMELIEHYTPRRVEGGAFRLFARCEGIRDEDAAELIGASIVRGNYPEPLRLAHIFAGAISSGESRGKA